MKYASLKKLSRGLSVWIVFALLLSPGLSSPVSAAAGDTLCVSVDPSGIPGNGRSAHATISPDGRYVVFESSATNLVADGTGDLYIRDLQTGQTTRLPVNGEGAVVSSGGRYVAFTAWVIWGETADDIMSDVYVYDRQTSVTTKVSVGPGGVQGNGWSDSPVISDDGRFIAFHSVASNLVAGDTNAAEDIFVHDMQTGVTQRVSIAMDGVEGNAGSSDPSVSADGRIVVFSSKATNLVSGDMNGNADIFVRDRQTGITTRVSVNSAGVEADHGATDASTAGDGRFISFSSFSENLMTQQPLGMEHVYVHDRLTGTTTLVTVNPDGFQFIARSKESVVSADGRFVAFQFDDRGDSQAIFIVRLMDRQTGIATTLTSPYAPGSSLSGNPSMSADGRFLTFTTGIPIISSDTNSVDDIYIHETSVGISPIPIVSSVQRPSGTFPTPASVSFTVNFNKVVTGVSIEDFALTMGGGVSAATPTGVSGSGSQYLVTVNTGTGDGFLRLDVLDDDSILDASLNPLGGVGTGNGNFTNGELFEIDKSIPVATGIQRTDPDPTVADHVHFTVAFSEPVSGVDAGDFAIVTTGGIAGMNVIEVVGSGASYTVTVNSGTGDGTLRLDLIDDDSITDAASTPLGGAGAVNGNFTSGESYTFERNIPIVNSITRMDANPSSAQSVNYRVTFSEPVTGLDISDFVLNQSGISGASIIAVNGSGNLYAVTVGTGTGSGTLRLDLIDNDSVVDSMNNPLGGAGIGNGNFISGEAYAINKNAVTYSTVTFRSGGSNDGWVLESNENSNIGGSVNAIAPVIRLGDDAQDAQYRAILHFPTEALPDNAVITRVILTLKRQGIAGTNPFSTHGNIQIDITTGYFGFDSYLGAALQPSDFQAPSTLNAVGMIQNNPVGDVYWSLLNGDANRFINLKGVTQLRLLFQLDDNDDLGDDYINFYSGDASEITDRPHLQIEYYVTR